MARTKAILLLTLLLVFTTGLTSAFDIKISVDPVTEANLYNPSYANSTEGIQNFNVTLENHASVGCKYYLRGRFQHGNQTETRYSNPYASWPGESKVLELKYLPMNYRGNIRSDIDITYCGSEKNVSSFEYNHTKKHVSKNMVTSETTKSNITSTSIEIPVSKGTLMPKKVPPYWKAGSAKIENNTAKVNYDAEIFRKKENITYTVIDSSGEVLGETKVSLKEPEPTLKERILERKWLIFAGLFFASLIGNGYLLRRKIIPESVREKLGELELGDRDIKN